jgi:hypothetical protein
MRQVHSTFLVEDERLPCANGGQPKLVLQVAQLPTYSRAEPICLVETPQPYVCVQQKFQSRSTSQSSSSFAGEMMSPRIFISFIEPIQSLLLVGAGGATSAMGRPRRVTRIGCLVFCTSSRIAKHLALNSEIAISLMTYIVDHSPFNWSISRKPKSVNGASCRDGYIFFSVDCKSHRGRIDRSAHLEVP